MPYIGQRICICSSIRRTGTPPSHELSYASSKSDQLAIIDIIRIIIGDWGVVPNREIDFGFGCGACVCVRACEAVCGREADVSFGARASEPKFVGCRAGPGRRAGPPPSRAVGVGTGPVEKVKKKYRFF